MKQSIIEEFLSTDQTSKWLDKQFGKELNDSWRANAKDRMIRLTSEAAQLHDRLAKDDRIRAQRQAAIYGINFLKGGTK